MNNSFLIKCGYDAWRKQIVNINLKQNNLWKTGSIILNNKIHYYRLNPMMNTRLEMIKIENRYLLTVNGGIIYEANKPFVYDTELFFHNDQNNFSDKNIYTCFDYESVQINKMKEIINLRTMN